jgi:hypothetical protein
VLGGCLLYHMSSSAMDETSAEPKPTVVPETHKRPKTDTPNGGGHHVTSSQLEEALSTFRLDVGKTIEAAVQSQQDARS